MKFRKVLIIIVFLIAIVGFEITSFAGDITNGINISGNKVGQFQNAGNIIFGIVKVAGILCSVGTLMLLGIKYMLGSVEEKAEYKKTFPIYVVGCMLVFGISTLVEFLHNWIVNL